MNASLRSLYGPATRPEIVTPGRDEIRAAPRRGLFRRPTDNMGEVPLAEDLVFTGPVASFDTADGFRAIAWQAGAGVRSFTAAFV